MGGRSGRGTGQEVIGARDRGKVGMFVRKEIGVKLVCLYVSALRQLVYIDCRQVVWFWHLH